MKTRRRRAQPKHRNPRPGRTDTLAGPVKITRPDGTVEIQPPLEGRALRALTKERVAFTQAQKDRIRRRDGDRCRYCGGSGPFEFDHVLPVAMGGPTSVRNGVLACEDCNRRKGASIWKPRKLR
jgi:hypothetical protein